jgi:hypothetical protein
VGASRTPGDRTRLARPGFGARIWKEVSNTWRFFSEVTKFTVWGMVKGKREVAGQSRTGKKQNIELTD